MAETTKRLQQRCWWKQWWNWPGERPGEKLWETGRPSPLKKQLLREGCLKMEMSVVFEGASKDAQSLSFTRLPSFSSLSQKRKSYLSKVGRKAVMRKNLNFSLFSSSQKFWRNHFKICFYFIVHLQWHICMEIKVETKKYKNSRYKNTMKSTCSSVCVVSVEVSEDDSHNWLFCHLKLEKKGVLKKSSYLGLPKISLRIFLTSPLQTLRAPPGRPRSSRECQWWRRPPLPPAWCCWPARNQSQHTHSSQLSTPTDTLG